MIHPAFILGNCPRLPIDDLGCLAERFTVGVNRILICGFVPTVLLWVDRTVYADDYRTAIDNCEALLVCDRSIASNQRHHGLRTWVGDVACKHPHPPPTELAVRGNTGACAARWALGLGCPDVYLVGMSGEYMGDATDFYGVNAHHQKRTVLRMRDETQRLMADFPGRVWPVPTGEMLRKVAVGLPNIDQTATRAEILGRIGQ